MATENATCRLQVETFDNAERLRAKELLGEGGDTSETATQRGEPGIPTFYERGHKAGGATSARRWRTPRGRNRAHSLFMKAYDDGGERGARGQGEGPTQPPLVLLGMLLRICDASQKLKLGHQHRPLWLGVATAQQRSPENSRVA